MAKTIACTCPQCSKQFMVETGHWNRSQKIGAPVYCGKACAGLSRRLKNPPSEQERRAAKAAYDAEYRERNAQRLKKEKADWYQRTRDPVREAQKRKERMHLHVEYCRRPEYKAKKQEYDRRYRASKEFGEFAEAALVLQGIEQEIEKRASRYEIYLSNGTINKALARRRAL